MKIPCWVYASLVLTALFASSPGLCADGTPLLDIRAYSREMGYKYFWDPLAKNAIVETSKGDLRFHAGSDYVLRNGRLEKMPLKAVYLDGALMAPPSAVGYLGPVPAVSGTVTSIPEPSRPSAGLFRIQKVIVDAGHGGKDPGASSSRGLKEKGLVLEIARKVKEGLEARGLEVIMTRNADVFIPLSERAQIANKNGADFFISIHANASTSASLDGFEIYYLSEATDDAALALERAENSVIQYERTSPRGLSKDLKTILWDLKESQNRKESIQASRQVMDSVSQVVDTGPKRLRSANFYVLKWTECPAILVELGYITNARDEKKLRTPAYKTALADALVEGFWAYKEEFERTEGFTQ